MIPNPCYGLFVLDIELADGTEHVPTTLGVLLLCVTDIVDEPEAASHRAQIAGLNAAVARLGDGAHGGERERSGRRQGLDEALQDGARGTGVRGQMDVDVGDEGGGDISDEDDGDDATKHD